MRLRSDSNRVIGAFFLTLVIFILLFPSYHASAQTSPKIVLFDPYFIDQTGNILSTVKYGDMLGIKSEIQNPSDDKQSFTYIIQIKNEKGIPVFLTWLEDISVAPGDTVKPSIFWISDAGGQLTVETYLWESITNPVPLTGEHSNTIYVTGYQKSSSNTNFLSKSLYDSTSKYDVDYNVIFLTHEDHCTWEDYGKMHFYNEVTYKYLLQWGLKPTYVDSLCLPATSLTSVPKEYLGLDLSILILNEPISEKYLLEDNHAWGYFEPPSLIVSSDAIGLKEKYGKLAESDVANEWTLSHELAHFVLYHMDEPKSIYIDWVHGRQKWDDYCMQKDPNEQNDSSCTEIYDTIVVNGMKLIVMKPYKHYDE